MQNQACKKKKVALVVNQDGLFYDLGCSHIHTPLELLLPHCIYFYLSGWFNFLNIRFLHTHSHSVREMISNVKKKVIIRLYFVIWSEIKIYYILVYREEERYVNYGSCAHMHVQKRVTRQWKEVVPEKNVCRSFYGIKPRIKWVIKW